MHKKTVNCNVSFSSVISSAVLQTDWIGKKFELSKPHFQNLQPDTHDANIVDHSAPGNMNSQRW